ncbi:transcriptional regulatory protein AfsQ1 [archaeon BMS3Abin16]|nr:transcriptional regulatory protein AfsQ1 [archaeon BMS3Abin16]HDY73927.1 response regulator [Euryarchaeota archaeon]
MANIMVVDDNPEITTLVKITLEAEGHSVTTAASGEECLGLLYSGVKPDLILLDIMMPEMDGWEVSRRIKENEKLKDIIICMLTAKTTTMDALMSLESAHANWHLNKPISRAKLVETVRWLLEG